jgi:hypothetical protein
MTDPHSGFEFSDVEGPRERPSREEAEGWTGDDWAWWFSTYVADFRTETDFEYGLPSSTRALLDSLGGVDGVEWRDTGPPDYGFLRLTRENRLRFLEGWYRVQDGLPFDEEIIGDQLSNTAASGKEAYFVDPTDDPAAGDTEQAADTAGSPPSPRRIQPKGVVVAITSAAAVALGLMFVVGGDDTPTPSEQTATEQTATEEDGATEASDASLPIDFLWSGGTATYNGPTSFTAGEPFDATITVWDENGDPVSGAVVYLSLGEGSPGRHFNAATTDADGQATFDTSPGAPTKPGTHKILTNIGGTVYEIAEAEVTER